MSGGPSVFDDRARSTFAGLADTLIPAGGGMPSASQSGAAGEWLDAVLSPGPTSPARSWHWSGAWTARTPRR